MAKPELEFFTPEDKLSWQPLEGADGLEEMILSKDPDTGDYSRLVRLAPGADTSRLGIQRHDFAEETWIVAGSLRDIRLEQTFTAGMYASRPPGAAHGPWRSREGCLMLEIRRFERDKKGTK